MARKECVRKASSDGGVGIRVQDQHKTSRLWKDRRSRKTKYQQIELMNNEEVIKQKSRRRWKYPRDKAYSVKDVWTESRQISHVFLLSFEQQWTPQVKCTLFRGGKSDLRATIWDVASLKRCEVRAQNWTKCYPLCDAKSNIEVSNTRKISRLKTTSVNNFWQFADTRT